MRIFRARRAPKPLRITFWINDARAVGPFTLEELDLIHKMIPGPERIVITPTLSISIDR